MNTAATAPAVSSEPDRCESTPLPGLATQLQPPAVALKPGEGTALGLAVRTVWFLTTGRSPAPVSSLCWGYSTEGQRQQQPGAETQQAPCDPTCRLSHGVLPLLAGGARETLMLPEVSQASVEAADLFHVGLGHPPLLAICQADPL